MSNAKRLTVELPGPIAAQIRAAVEAGEYASTADAVIDAVRLWSDQRLFQEPDIEHLREAWDAGKASGVHGPIDFDLLRLKARKRLEEAVAKTSNGGRRLVSTRLRRPHRNLRQDRH